MTIMYKTGWMKPIETIEVVRETKCFYIINYNGAERKEGKVSGWGQFHATFEDAKNYLINNAYKKIKRNLEINAELEQDIIKYEGLIEV